MPTSPTLPDDPDTDPGPVSRSGARSRRRGGAASTAGRGGRRVDPSGDASPAAVCAAALLVLAAPAEGAWAQERPDPGARGDGAAGGTPAAVALDGASDPADADREKAGEVVSMLDLARHEYAEAVRDGEVVNGDEYAEARAFTGRAAGLFDELSAGDGGGRSDVARGRARVAARLDSLAAVVERNGPPARYRDLVDRVAADLEAGWGAVAVPEPTRTPSADRGARLYRAACAVCHGPAGGGDGRAADGMDPAPPDLATAARREEASPELDYQVIMHGIPETAMPASRDWLSPDGAWDLVAYLRSLMDLPPPEPGEGEESGPGG